MRLSDYMANRGLKDEHVADGIGRSRVSVSRYRRGLERPTPEVIDRIYLFTDGLVSGDDWMRVQVAEEAAQ